MKRWILILAMLLIPTGTLGQTAAVNGYCTLGAAPAVTSGLDSSNYLQGIVPNCTVTIYYTGTTNLVPGSVIYSNSTGTILGNPFTGNTDGSWLFYALTGIGYDIVLSGGNPVPVSTYWPKTLTDVFAGGGLALQHNGTALSDQGLLNFSDTTPDAPPGASQVLFQTDSGGDLSAYTIANVGGGLSQMVQAPTVDGYGYAILYPTAYFIPTPTGYCTAAATDTSGAITEFTGSGLGAACEIVYTGFSLPPGLLAANIKAIYGFTVSGYEGSSQNQIELSCTDGTYGGILYNFSHINFPMNPYSLEIANSVQAPSFNYANASCTASLVAYGSSGYPALYQVNTVALIVYGAFMTLAQPGLQVALPLSYNATLDQLGLGLVPSWLWSPGDAGTSGGAVNAYTLTYLQPTPAYSLGLQEVFTPAANNTSTTPTLNVDGLGAVTITKCGTAALVTGDLITTSLANVIDDGTYFELQNPQHACGTSGSGLSGMTAGQVPIAASASTVTSSKVLAGGGSGIATGPTSTTLNDCVKYSDTSGTLADAGAGCGSGSSFISSLSTSGTTGPATVAGGVLNIPQYTSGGSSTIDILSPGKPSGTTLGTYQKDGTVIASSTLTLLSYVPTTITAWSINGSDIATFTASNSMMVGQEYVLSGFTTGSFFNGQTITVLAAGLSSSQFEANFTHVSGSASESGLATPLPGYVSRIWVALQGADPSNCTVEVFLNGSGGASISVPLQNFYLATYAYQDSQVPSALSTYFTSYNQTTGTGSTYSFTLPIPFTTGIQIAIVNTTASTLTDWYMVDYHIGVPNTWPYTEVLHVDVNTDVTGITANTVTTLTNYTGGNPGRFVGMWWLEDSNPGSVSPVAASMEGAFALYLDGAASPNITSSGTEDWFGYGYYFGGNGLPQTYSSAPGAQIPGGWMDASGQVTVMNVGTTNGKTDSAVRYHLIDPIYFNTGLKMTWACGNTSYISFTGTCTLWSTVFYYTQQ